MVSSSNSPAALQSEVALAIARGIKLQLTPQEEAGLATARPVKPETLDAALKGRFHWRKLTEAGISNAFHYFRQAIALDATYAPAYAGLADCYALAGGWTLPPREAWSKVKEQAQKALELEDTLADGYASRSAARMFSDWDWAGAENDLKRAIELSPNTALFRDYYANFLIYMGRFEEAIAEANKAIELERLSPLFRNDLAFCYYFKRDYPRAMLEAREVVALDPNFPYARLVLGWAYAKTGKTNEAIAEFEKCEQSDPGSPIAKGFLGAGYAFANRRAEALRINGELKAMSTNRYVPVVFYALIQSFLGEQEQALEWLEKALEAREPAAITLKTDPLFDSLRSHPRFQAMLKQLNFPP